VAKEGILAVIFRAVQKRSCKEAEKERDICSQRALKKLCMRR
jgi:hypothetical protein